MKQTATIYGPQHGVLFTIWTCLHLCPISVHTHLTFTFSTQTFLQFPRFTVLVSNSLPLTICAPEFESLFSHSLYGNPYYSSTPTQHKRSHFCYYFPDVAHLLLFLVHSSNKAFIDYNYLCMIPYPLLVSQLLESNIIK